VAHAYHYQVDSETKDRDDAVILIDLSIGLLFDRSPLNVLSTEEHDP
jgi:hypothetical protein